MLDEYTVDQLNVHMILILTKRRQKMKKRFIKAIVGTEEAKNPGTVFHGAELAPKVSRVFFTVFLPQYNAATNIRYKFALLYGFTTAIYQYWFWMQRHPTNWDGHAMLLDLAREWTAMFRREPEELGLDPVFSYPGVRELLKHFKKGLEEERCHCDVPLKFKFE